MKRTRARVLTSIGICLLLLTGCCGAHVIQGPVWGRVEVADAAEAADLDDANDINDLNDIVVYLYCRSHAFHGSYTADKEYRVVSPGERFVFPWMFGGIAPTGCSLRVIHPLYQPAYLRFEKGAHRGLSPIPLESWDEVLRRAEQGEDVSPVTTADLNRHVFEIRHHFLGAHAGDRAHREIAHYVPALHRIYERGLHGLPPMDRDPFGSTRSSLEYLREIEATVGYEHSLDAKALFAAAASGDSSALNRLLSGDVDPDRWNADGEAAIHLATRAGHADGVAALLDRGARIDRQREGLGNTALLEAIQHHRVETALLLIARGADVTLGAQGRVPLSAATRNGTDSRVFLALLERGGVERARNPRDVADALHGASRNGRVELLRALLARDVPADLSRGAPGFTPLMVAALDGQLGTTRLLIEAGADVNARTDDGQTPLSMARKRERAPHRRAEVVALLEQSGASE